MAQLFLPPSSSQVEDAAKLTVALSDVIRQWTTISPMTIEDIVASVAFTAGYAIGNRPDPDKIRLPTRKLRELAIDRLDKGIEQAKTANGGSTIVIPGANGNNIGVVK